MLLVAVLACSGGPGGGPSAGPPVLHRLTEPQIEQSLRDLFLDPDLPALALPRDVAVDGFDNNALTRDATPFLVESLQRDMVEVVRAAVGSEGWQACDPGDGPPSVSCAHDTLKQTLQRAWRRPATAEEVTWIQGLYDGWRQSTDASTALQLSLQVILQSPDFLYLVEQSGSSGQLDDWTIASKLSYALWDTMPDVELFRLASEGRLQDRRVVEEQAKRLLSDPRSRTAMRRFLRQWLGYEWIQQFEPDPSLLYANADDEDEEDVGGSITMLRLSFEEEFDRFLDQAVWGSGTLDAVLTSRETWVTQETARLYGVEPDESRGVRIERPVGLIDVVEFSVFPATLDPEQRAGFFTTGAFLAGHSHSLQPSPVLRSVFLRDRMLCIDPIPPPDDVPPLEDEAETASWTTNRERYAEHTENPACSGCHIPIDGAGFPFESYDALGAYRTMDNGAPVDTTGQLVGTDVDGPVTDAIELIESLAVSRQVYDCTVTQIFRYGMHRSETEADQAALQDLQQRFFDNGGVIPELLVDFVTSDAFLTHGGAK